MKTLEEYRDEFNYLTEEFDRTYKTAVDIKKLVSLYDTVISTYESQDSDMKDVFATVMDAVNIQRVNYSLSAIKFVLKKRIDDMMSLYNSVSGRATNFDIISHEFGDWSDLALNIYDKSTSLKKKIDKI